MFASLEMVNLLRERSGRANQQRCRKINNGDHAMSTATLVEQKLGLQQALARLIDMLNSHDVEGARAYVKELVREWPDAELVQHYVRVLEPPRVLPSRPGTGKSFTQAETAWLKAHAHEYPGCWIAIDDGRMIAADPDLKVVRKAAKEDGADDPLYHFTPDPDKWP
jgi:hypothetical protein